MGYDFFHRVPAIGYDRINALETRYAHAYNDENGWPSDNTFRGAFEVDDRVLDRLPAPIANEIRAQLDDDNSLNSFRQGVRSCFYRARKVSEERSVEALFEAIRDKTVANHPAAVNALVPPKATLSPFETQLVLSNMSKVLSDDRPKPIEVTGKALAALDLSDLPGGVTAFKGHDGIYLQQYSDHYYLGEPPPEQKPTDKNPTLTKPLRFAIEDLVASRINEGQGFWELSEPPVETTARLPHVEVDPPDLLSARRDAYLIGGHLYATYEVGGGHRWFYLGPLPEDVAKRVDIAPELSGLSGSEEFLRIHPKAEPIAEAPQAFHLDRGSQVARLNEQLGSRLDGTKAKTYHENLASAREALNLLEGAGVKTVSMFLSSIKEDAWTAVPEALKRISFLHQNMDLPAVWGDKGIAITRQDGTPTDLLFDGSVAQNRARGIRDLAPWRQSTIPTVEINLEVDPPAVRFRNVQTTDAGMGLDYDWPPERVARTVVEMYAYTGPRKVTVRRESRLSPGKELLPLEEVRARCTPIFERAVEKGLIDGFELLEGGDGYILSFPEVQFDPPGFG